MQFIKIRLSLVYTRNTLSGRWPCAGVPTDDVRRSRTRNSRRAGFGFSDVRYLAAIRLHRRRKGGIYQSEVSLCNLCAIRAEKGL